MAPGWGLWEISLPSVLKTGLDMHAHGNGLHGGDRTGQAAARLPALDGLRALAICVVLVHNVSVFDRLGASLAEKVWNFVVGAGWIGVQLFFVLSGYLITGILLDGRDQPHGLRTFYVRRSLRIFPLYYLFLIGRFLLLPLFIPAAAVAASSQIWFWLYLSNWSELFHRGVDGLSHFWSLAVEEQFYLSWPWAVRRLSPRRFVQLCVGLTVLPLLARVTFWVAHVDQHWSYFSTLARADGLAWGALVAIAARSTWPREKLARLWKVATMVSVAGLGAVLVFVHGFSRFQPVVETVGYTLFAAFFASLLFGMVTRPGTPGGRWLENRWLVRVGRYSYAMYLFHAPLRQALMQLVLPKLSRGGEVSLALDLVWVVGIALLTFVLAALSYALVERPILKLKDRWAPG
jgi:peptidoglycan/LPS O-acetylase OafA/YrhL